jgi:hypothetical protein
MSGPTEKIRNALDATPRTAASLIAATGVSKREFRQSMAQMVGRGMAAVDRTVWPRTYVLGRPKQSAAELAEKSRARIVEINDRRRQARETAPPKPVREKPAATRQRKTKSVMARVAAVAIVAAQNHGPRRVLDSAQLEADIAAFLAQGGRVKQLEPHETSPENRLKFTYDRGNRA